jgi:uncharacterized protein
VPTEHEISLLPAQLEDENTMIRAVEEQLGTTIASPLHLRIVKKSLDARQRPIRYHLRIQLFKANEKLPELITNYQRKVDASRPRVAIIGAGPAGLFAALRLLEAGACPVIYERGKPVRERRRDLAILNKEHLVNPESNYCFGEGGAGTYSDGKLYTRSKKRGSVRKILEVLVEHGADPGILVDAHPHIGTNKLPSIITAIRETITSAGGEVHFNSKVTDFVIAKGSIRGVEINGTDKHDFDHVILATGHSARDIYRLLHAKKVLIEFKPFALGVRVEHPQAIIDQSQYKLQDRGEFLPPAAYSLVSQVEGRGVFSFCMCPGGIIAPCATEPGEVVTNGWSPSKRNNPFANSGVVTPVEWEDIQEFHKYGPLAGLEFQEHIEKSCWEAGGQTQRVPAQRLVDFVEGKLSADLPTCSYQPGVTSARVDELLPDFIALRLKAAMKDYGNKIRGYFSNDAIVVAPESRTSSPVRIPRDKETLCHPEITGFYPCGEGAGYAGGIVSAAMDGERIAELIAQHS